MNSEKFDHKKFEKMTDDQKYDYCISRRNGGIRKHGGVKKHKKNKGYLHEKKLCCDSINRDNLTGERKNNSLIWKC